MSDEASTATALPMRKMMSPKAAPTMMKKAPVMMKKMVKPPMGGKMPTGKLLVKPKGIPKGKIFKGAPTRPEFDTSPVVPPSATAQGEQSVPGHKAFQRVPSLPPPVPSRTAGESPPDSEHSSSAPDTPESTKKASDSESGPSVAPPTVVSPAVDLVVEEVRAEEPPPSEIPADEARPPEVQDEVDSSHKSHIEESAEPKSEVEETPTPDVVSGEAPQPQVSVKEGSSGSSTEGRGERRTSDTRTDTSPPVESHHEDHQPLSVIEGAESRKLETASSRSEADTSSSTESREKSTSRAVDEAAPPEEDEMLVAGRTEPSGEETEVSRMSLEAPMRKGSGERAITEEGALRQEQREEETMSPEATDAVAVSTGGDKAAPSLSDAEDSKKPTIHVEDASSIDNDDASQLRKATIESLTVEAIASDFLVSRPNSPPDSFVVDEAAGMRLESLPSRGEGSDPSLDDAAMKSRTIEMRISTSQATGDESIQSQLGQKLKEVSHGDSFKLVQARDCDGSMVEVQPSRSLAATDEARSAVDNPATSPASHVEEVTIASFRVDTIESREARADGSSSLHLKESEPPPKLPRPPMSQGNEMHPIEGYSGGTRIELHSKEDRDDDSMMGRSDIRPLDNVVHGAAYVVRGLEIQSQRSEGTANHEVREEMTVEDQQGHPDEDVRITSKDLVKGTYQTSLQLQSSQIFQGQDRSQDMSQHHIDKAQMMSAKHIDYEVETPDDSASDDSEERTVEEPQRPTEAVVTRVQETSHAISHMDSFKVGDVYGSRREVSRLVEVRSGSVERVERNIESKVYIPSGSRVAEPASAMGSQTVGVVQVEEVEPAIDKVHRRSSSNDQRRDSATSPLREIAIREAIVESTKAGFAVEERIILSTASVHKIEEAASKETAFSVHSAVREQPSHVIQRRDSSSSHSSAEQLPRDHHGPFSLKVIAENVTSEQQVIASAGREVPQSSQADTSESDESLRAAPSAAHLPKPTPSYIEVRGGASKKQKVAVQTFDLSSMHAEDYGANLPAPSMTRSRLLPTKAPPQVAVVQGFLSDDVTESASEIQSLLTTTPDFDSSYRAPITPTLASPAEDKHRYVTEDSEDSYNDDEDETLVTESESVLTGPRETEVIVPIVTEQQYTIGGETVLDTHHIQETSPESEDETESQSSRQDEEEADADRNTESIEAHTSLEIQTSEGCAEGSTGSHQTLDVTERLRQLVHDTQAMMADTEPREGLSGVQILDAIQQGGPPISSPRVEATQAVSHVDDSSRAKDSSRLEEEESSDQDDETHQEGSTTSDVDNNIAVVVGLTDSLAVVPIAGPQASGATAYSATQTSQATQLEQSTGPTDEDVASLRRNQEGPGISHPKASQITSGEPSPEAAPVEERSEASEARSVSYDIAQVERVIPPFSQSSPVVAVGVEHQQASPYTHATEVVQQAETGLSSYTEPIHALTHIETVSAPQHQSEEVVAQVDRIVPSQIRYVATTEQVVLPPHRQSPPITPQFQPSAPQQYSPLITSANYQADSSLYKSTTHHSASAPSLHAVASTSQNQSVAMASVFQTATTAALSQTEAQRQAMESSHLQQSFRAQGQSRGITSQYQSPILVSQTHSAAPPQQQPEIASQYESRPATPVLYQSSHTTHYQSTRSPQFQSEATAQYHVTSTPQLRPETTLHAQSMHPPHQVGKSAQFQSTSHYQAASKSQYQSAPPQYQSTPPQYQSTPPQYQSMDNLAQYQPSAVATKSQSPVAAKYQSTTVGSHPSGTMTSLFAPEVLPSSTNRLAQRMDDALGTTTPPQYPQREYTPNIIASSQQASTNTLSYHMDDTANRTATSHYSARDYATEAGPSVQRSAVSPLTYQTDNHASTTGTVPHFARDIASKVIPSHQHSAINTLPYQADDVVSTTALSHYPTGEYASNTVASAPRNRISTLPYQTEDTINTTAVSHYPQYQTREMQSGRMTYGRDLPSKSEVSHFANQDEGRVSTSQYRSSESTAATTAQSRGFGFAKQFNIETGASREGATSTRQLRHSVTSSVSRPLLPGHDININSQLKLSGPLSPTHHAPTIPSRPRTSLIQSTSPTTTPYAYLAKPSPVNHQISSYHVEMTGPSDGRYGDDYMTPRQRDRLTHPANAGPNMSHWEPAPRDSLVMSAPPTPTRRTPQNAVMNKSPPYAYLAKTPPLLPQVSSYRVETAGQDEKVEEFPTPRQKERMTHLSSGQATMSRWDSALGPRNSMVWSSTPGLTTSIRKNGQKSLITTKSSPMTQPHSARVGDTTRPLGAELRRQEITRHPSLSGFSSRNYRPLHFPQPSTDIRAWPSPTSVDRKTQDGRLQHQSTTITHNEYPISARREGVFRHPTSIADAPRPSAATSKGTMIWPPLKPALEPETQSRYSTLPTPFKSGYSADYQSPVKMRLNELPNHSTVTSRNFSGSWRPPSRLASMDSLAWPKPQATPPTPPQPHSQGMMSSTALERPNTARAFAASAKTDPLFRREGVYRHRTANLESTAAASRRAESVIRHATSNSAAPRQPSTSRNNTAIQWSPPAARKEWPSTALSPSSKRRSRSLTKKGASVQRKKEGHGCQCRC